MELPNISGTSPIIVGTTISGFDGSGYWNFHNRSTQHRTVYQYIRELPNGRYDQIRYNNHENEGPHTHIKIMLSPDKIPVISGLQSKIHRLILIVNGIRKFLEEDEY